MRRCRRPHSKLGWSVAPAPDACASPAGNVASGLDWDSLWMQIYGCHHGPNQQWELSNW